MKKLFYKTSLKHATLFKKETPTQMFSCEYCEIFKSTYFDEHLRTAASKEYKILIVTNTCFRYSACRRS